MGTNADGYTEFSYTVYVDYTDKECNIHSRIEYPVHNDDMVVGDTLTVEYDPANPEVLVSDNKILDFVFPIVDLGAIVFRKNSKCN